MGILYILKLVCLLQKYWKNGYVVYIKTSMFTTEIRKNGYAVHIKTSMLLVEITGMLYIGNHKISFVRVLLRPRDSTK